MANGASGCGYENRNFGGLCGFLTREGNIEDAKECTFTCLKYKEVLEQQPTTGEPFRCTKCCNQQK